MKILGFEIRWPEKVTSCGRNPKVDEYDFFSGPHCDSLILHGPSGGCWACNEMVDAQLDRIHKGINFTGERVSTRKTCPAELERPLKTIYAWPGNRPFSRYNA